MLIFCPVLLLCVSVCIQVQKVWRVCVLVDAHEQDKEWCELVFLTVSRLHYTNNLCDKPQASSKKTRIQTTTLSTSDLHFQQRAIGL